MEVRLLLIRGRGVRIGGRARKVIAYCSCEHLDSRYMVGIRLARGIRIGKPLERQLGPVKSPLKRIAA